MEVKNPLFKEDFNASCHNIISSSHSANSMPPPYSTIENSSVEPIKYQSITTESSLIEINETSQKQKKSDISTEQDQVVNSLPLKQ
jgi:hypothetical protein